VICPAGFDGVRGGESGDAPPGVPLVDPAADAGLQGGDAAVGEAAQPAGGQLSEPAFPRFCRDELPDLQARPVYHRKRDSVVARLTIVFAALAATRPIEARTGWSIRNSSRLPAAAAPSRSRPDGRPSPLPTPSPPTQLRTASISPAPGTDRTQPTPAPGALAAPGPAGLAGVEGKPIRGARPAEMIAGTPLARP
jgi:hypothetical protein